MSAKALLYATQYFSLANGQYKATLYGKQLPNGTLEDEKAKSKVFKVECALANGVQTYPSDTVWNDKKGNQKVDAGECVTAKGGRGGDGTTTGEILDATVTTTTTTSPTATSQPTELAKTGVNSLLVSLGGVLAAITAAYTCQVNRKQYTN